MHSTQEALEEEMLSTPTMDVHPLRWGIKVETWLAVLPYIMNGADLGDQEWRCDLLLHYRIDPQYLPNQCDGCNSALSICYELDCKKSSLIMNHCNKLRDGVANLSGKAFTPSNHLYLMKIGRAS